MVTLAFVARLAATKSDPRRKDTASAPRCVAMSVLHTSDALFLFIRCISASGTEPTMASLHTIGVDHSQGCSVHLGRKHKLVLLASSPSLSFGPPESQCHSTDLPTSMTMMLLASDDEALFTSTAQSDAFVKTSRGRKVTSWQRAPSASCDAMGSACKQKRSVCASELRDVEPQPAGKRNAATSGADEEDRLLPWWMPQWARTGFTATSVGTTPKRSSRSSSMHFAGSSVSPLREGKGEPPCVTYKRSCDCAPALGKPDRSASQCGHSTRSASGPAAVTQRPAGAPPSSNLASNSWGSNAALWAVPCTPARKAARLKLTGDDHGEEGPRRTRMISSCAPASPGKRKTFVRSMQCTGTSSAAPDDSDFKCNVTSPIGSAFINVSIGCNTAEHICVRRGGDDSYAVM
mmetsp:Transcript_88873/g.272199  ORF Transcript_88873/g.272199 Transcript_88873/m.272199 type:complete len:405 (-) Transcript_88873:1363-2577(-)